MGLILAIETTTKNCSVSLFEKDQLISYKEEFGENYIHSESLLFFIQETLSTANYNLYNLDAIAISKGPGSYTGLRIGAASAKGLCYSLNIPLISISTLKVMAYAMSNREDSFYYCAMIDARRNEVFAAIYDQNINIIRDIQVDVVDKKTYIDFLDKKIIFFGDGAKKCKTLINHKMAVFVEGIYPSSKDMGVLIYNKFIQKDFDDIAYFEPHYLKDFVVG
tara:strand:+ start:474 stop:1136 length:663 start_codon:yes stop_codon:yes gene_type:complete